MDHTIAIAGAGYVGLVTGACLASARRRVIMVEVDPERRQTLAEGRVPIYEPGLEPLLRAALDGGHLEVTDDWAAALAEASMVPPTWHGWLHHTVDVPPTQSSAKPWPWEKPHRPNLTGTPLAWRPPGSVLAEGVRPPATGDYKPWTPQ